MNLEQLKKDIENKIQVPDVLIFNCKAAGSEFIFHQYVDRYARDNSLNIEYIETLDNLCSTNLFSVAKSNMLYIYEIDKLEQVPNISNQTVWIKCKSIPKKVAEACDNILITLTKIEEWQVRDYIDSNLGELPEKIRDKFFTHYKSDLFRLELEIEKLKIFSDNLESNYNQIADQLFVDSSEYNIFDITNCIIRRDIKGLNKLKNTLQFIDVDAFGLLKILTNNFKHIIDIQLAKNSTPEYVGVTPKQFWAIKNYSCGYYSRDELIYIYQRLLKLDSDIKSGYISADTVVDYIICKILLI